MSEAAQVILLAIEDHKKKIKELESALKKIGEDVPKKRRRKATGLRPDSMPFHVHAILTAAQGALSAADISAKLAKLGKATESRVIASALNRYIENRRIFDRTDDGLYTLRNEAA
jgi:hypothetical protein